MTDPAAEAASAEDADPPPWAGWLAAVGGPLAALAVRVALMGVFRGYPFLTFFPAVALTALAGTRAQTGVCIVLSAGLAQRFLTDEPGLSGRGSANPVAITLFALVCVALAALIRASRRAFAEAARSRRALAALNVELEARVRARTAELAAESRARGEAEAQLRQAQKMEAVGQLTGGVAHDFNNMLAVVIGSLELAQRRLSRGEGDVGSLLTRAMEGAQKSAALTQRLLAFARKQPLAPAPSDVNALVRGLSELLRRTLGETVRFECVLAGGLWRATVDPAQLESALLNLAVNARDAMPEGGRVTVETQNGWLDDDYAAQHGEVTPGQYVVVAVSDTGEGMTPEVAAMAFEPFFTTKEAGRGTGLGLSQVYGFIKQSGGHVKIYSELGQGTTVRLYLPRTLAEADPLSASRLTAAAAVPPPRARAGERVLVVEDEAQVRAATVSALEELGYTVVGVDGGPAALALLEAGEPVSLLFTDVMMPGMTGRRLADAARALRPGLPVLYTTGYTPNAIVHNGVIDPGVSVVTKPFALDHLAAKVRAAIDG